MSSVDVSSQGATGSPPVNTGEMRLEVVVISDADGNGWLLQEITTRLPGR